MDTARHALHEVRAIERAISQLDLQLESVILATGTSLLKLHGVGTGGNAPGSHRRYSPVPHRRPLRRLLWSRAGAHRVPCARCDFLNPIGLQYARQGGYSRCDAPHGPRSSVVALDARLGRTPR
jgi:hypothetical protein